MEPITAFTPYNLENFKWLIEKSSAHTYLSEESLQRIDSAIKQGNEQSLRQFYPVILNQYIAERNISVNFAISQENAIHKFVDKVEKVGLEVKTEIKTSHEAAEEAEHSSAEDLLKNL